MVISPAGVQLIKDFEGCRNLAYQDSVGVWSIGYGHTQGVTKGMYWSQAQSDARLAQDLDVFETDVTDALGSTQTTQPQFDALVSFAYNLGVGALRSSTLFRLHLSGDHAGAACQFPLWVHAGTKVLLGLVKRRFAEATLYLEGTTV